MMCKASSAAGYINKAVYSTLTIAMANRWTYNLADCK